MLLWHLPVACTVAVLTPGGPTLLQFWELDADHDFFICKEDLLRYGNHSLTYRIVDRIFSQVKPTLGCVQLHRDRHAGSTLVHMPCSH